MPKRLTVFYSWQSDSPANLNRNFIEKALREALKRLNSDATLESALRDAKVVLDKDTQGVAGSPPIAETILRKIDDCAVFVADLTFVGESKNGFTNAARKPRLFPNPNVLIEYGYALKRHSHSRIIAVMNTAFGEPNAESLPFDLRHLRWPICYGLADPASVDRSMQYDQLTERLMKEIKLILSDQPLEESIEEVFLPQKPANDCAVFFNNAMDLVGDRSEKFSIPFGAKAYLRLYPRVIVSPISSELAARSLAANGNLQPLGRVRGYGYDRNIFGAISYESPEDGKLYHFTQLFLNREIWGVDAQILNADHLREQLQQWLMNDSVRYIASRYIEEFFVGALQNYLIFAQSHLKLPVPLNIEGGLVGVRGYSIAVGVNQIIGKSLRDTIQWHGNLEAYGEPPWKILAPFFDQIWESCGVLRTAQHQDELERRFVVSPQTGR